MELVTIDQAYDALRVYLELETQQARGNELHAFASEMAFGEDGKRKAEGLYSAFRGTVKSDPMSLDDAMRCASEFLGQVAGSNVAIARVSDDLREAAFDTSQSSLTWQHWQEAVNAL